MTRITTKLTKAEFQERLQHVAASRKIFFDTGLTKSLDLAFEMYLAVFDNLSFPLKIPASQPAERQCPICGFKSMVFEKGCCGGTRSRVICPSCQYEEFT